MGRKLKILTTHPEHWARGYAGDCGVEVVWVDPGGDDPKRNTGEQTRDGVGQVCTEAGLQKLINAADSFRPDVFLFAIHHGFEREHVEAISEQGTCKVVMHYTDQRDGVPPEVAKYKGLLDLLLVTNAQQDDHDKYVTGGCAPAVRVMLDGVDLDAYDAHRAWRTHPGHDVFFGGHDYHGLARQFRAQGDEPPLEILLPGSRFRHQLMLHVNSRFDMVVRGKYGWSSNFRVKPMVFHPYYHEAMIEGRIILNTTNAPRHGLVTRRTLRSMASGRLYVTDYLPGTDHLFGDGEHLVKYRSVSDAIEKIDWYLNDDAGRRMIEKNAARLIRDKHTYPHRLAEFVQIIDEVF